MALAILVSILFAFIPALFYSYILYILDRYEKEPKLLLSAVFFWGAVVAAGGAFLLNTIFGVGVFVLTGSEMLSDLLTGSISAPFIEEALKGLAVLLIFFFFRNEFDSVLDGIIYAGITALGFAATENVLYLTEQGFGEGGWEGLLVMFFLRVILGAWNHVIYTAFFGIGLALARLNRNWFVRILAPLVGWSLAMFTHFMHNTLASFAQDAFGVLALFGTDWLGWFFMFLIIIWAILAERNWIKKNLLEELESGLLTPDQYKMSYSAGALSILRFRAIFAGKYRVTRQYYQLCVELAYKKHQRAKRGEEYSNTVFIEQLRDEISRLGPEAFAG